MPRDRIISGSHWRLPTRGRVGPTNCWRFWGTVGQPVSAFGWFAIRRPRPEWVGKLWGLRRLHPPLRCLKAAAFGQEELFGAQLVAVAAGGHRRRSVMKAYWMLPASENQGVARLRRSRVMA